MAFKGMDPDAGRTVAETIAKTGESTQDVFDQLTSLVNGVEWIGPDRDTYIEDWTSLISNHLSPLIDAYNTMADNLNTQAEEQDTTSNEG